MSSLAMGPSGWRARRAVEDHAPGSRPGRRGGVPARCAWRRRRGPPLGAWGDGAGGEAATPPVDLSAPAKDPAGSAPVRTVKEGESSDLETSMSEKCRRASEDDDDDEGRAGVVRTAKRRPGSPPRPPVRILAPWRRRGRAAPLGSTGPSTATASGGATAPVAAEGDGAEVEGVAAARRENVPGAPTSTAGEPW